MFKKSVMFAFFWAQWVRKPIKAIKKRIGDKISESEVPLKIYKLLYMYIKILNIYKLYILYIYNICT